MSSSKSQKSKQLSLTFSFSNETSDYSSKQNVEFVQSFETIYLKSLLAEIVSQKQQITDLNLEIVALRKQNQTLLQQNYNFFNANSNQQPFLSSPLSSSPFIPAPVPTPMQKSERHFSTLLLSHHTQNSNREGGLPEAPPLIFSQWGSKRTRPVVQPTMPKPKSIGAVYLNTEQARGITSADENLLSIDHRKAKKPRLDRKSKF